MNENKFNSIREKLNLVSKSRGIKNILFVCLGNLCRSPMADYLLREYFRKSGNTDIKVSSGGFLDQTGAKVPKEINDLMSKAKINISEHRSSPITQERIRKSDLIIVMEKEQKEQLVRQLPEDAPRIFLLSQFDKQNPEERDIADPIGQTSSFYKNCFDEIKILVENLAAYSLEVK